MKTCSHAALTLLLLITSLTIAVSCGSSDENASETSSRRNKAPTPVHVETIKRGALHLDLDLIGEVKARRSVDVAVETTGKLVDVLVEMGDEVTKGQLLAKLDTTQLQAKLAEAQAARAMNKAAIERAEAEYQSTASDLARKAPLAEDELVTPQEMDQLRAKRDSARASVEVARAQVAKSNAAIRVLRQQLGDTRVVAPFDGRVQQRLLDPGAIVKAGSPILRLVHTNPAVVTFQVNEHAVGALRQRSVDSETPLDVELTLPAYPGKRWTGQLARLAPALDPETRAATAEAEFENGAGDLMPGMFCRVRIDLGGRDNVLLVPLGALVGQSKSGSSAASVVGDDRGDNAVFVVREGKVKRTKIRVGAERKGYGEVLVGLEEGAVVVTEGHIGLRDGRAVRVIEREGR